MHNITLGPSWEHGENFNTCLREFSEDMKAALDNIGDNLFYCSKKFKKENETFISLD